MARAADGGPGKKFDLEDRTYRFAERVREFMKGVEKTISNAEDLRQLARASGSVGANSIEAKESRHWLRLLRLPAGSPADLERNALAQEAEELKLILSAITRNSGGERY